MVGGNALLPSLSLMFCFQRRASGLLKLADIRFELPCLGLDPTTRASSHYKGMRQVFAGSLCLWDAKSRKGRRIRQSWGWRICVCTQKMGGRMGSVCVQGWGGHEESEGFMWAGGVWCRGRGGSTADSPVACGMCTGCTGGVAVARPSGKSNFWRGRGGTASCEALPGLQGAQAVADQRG